MEFSRAAKLAHLTRLHQAEAIVACVCFDSRSPSFAPRRFPHFPFRAAPFGRGWVSKRKSARVHSILTSLPSLLCHTPAVS